MTFEDLRVFVTVAAERSFSRAARKLRRTQPAVSQAIRRLEQAAGERLIDRSSRDGTLTDAGEVLLEYGSRLIRLADEAAGAVADLREARSGRVVIGANEGGVHAVLPLIAAFRRDHPAILVEVRRLSARQMPQEVSLRAVDFGVVTFNPPDRELASLIVTTDELVLLVRPDHPLADRRQITMEEMGRQTVIAHNDPSPTRERVLKLYEQRQTQLNIRLSLPSLDAIKRAVEMGLGVALLPRRCAQGEISRGELVEIRVPELRSPRQVRLVHRREAQLSHAARAFLEVARREVGTDQVRS
ncbi:MAG TPA: LysR substrate-binding domain-containing protein [Vicinamibacterales bacterium]|jgi:DNA-binding transcriptional LysR family regulator|nr:LysR substrate-binding domain-containing protein [Vicinamibacterales bacterium]